MNAINLQSMYEFDHGTCKKNMIFCKKLVPNEVAFGVKKIVWEYEGIKKKALEWK